MLTAGLSSSLALKVIDRSYDRQLAVTASDAANQRAIAAFRESVAGIQTAEDFVQNWDAYSFVMRAFDLEDQIFGRAIIRKMLESDISDPAALVNRLSDARFRDLYKVMGFTDGGSSTPNTTDPAWQDEMVERFVERRFINSQEAGNPDLGLVLEFRQKADEIDSWFDVLKSKDVSQFMRTALGIPDSVAGLDLDRQVAIFESRMDLEDFKDPEIRAGLERKFTALADARAATQGIGSNPIVQLIQGQNRFTPVTLDIAAIVSMPRAPYR